MRSSASPAQGAAPRRGCRRRTGRSRCGPRACAAAPGQRRHALAGDAQLDLDAAAHRLGFDVENLRRLVDDVLGQGEAAGEILDVAGRGHHHGMADAVVDQRHRDFLGDDLVARLAAGRREPARGPANRAAPFPGRRRALYLAGFSVTDATPAATFRPTLPSTLTGCRAICLLDPPTSTLAPRPTPKDAPAVTPP